MKYRIIKKGRLAEEYQRGYNRGEKESRDIWRAPPVPQPTEEQILAQAARITRDRDYYAKQSEIGRALEDRVLNAVSDADALVAVQALKAYRG